MPDELYRVIDAIKADAHGGVARNAAHWLAVEVMRWGFDWEHQRKIEAERESYTFTPYTETGIGFVMLSPIAKGRPYDLDYYYETWNPLTNANHTRMLVMKVGSKNKIKPVLKLEPYSDDLTHDACQVLMKYYADGILTDESLKGFLNDH